MNELGLIIVSNLSYFFPATIALLTGYYWFSIIIILAMISSVLYHVNQNGPIGLYKKIDQFFAWAVILANVFFIARAHFHDNVFFYLALAFSLLAIKMYFKDGEEYYKHAYWHILSSLVTLFSVLTALN